MAASQPTSVQQPIPLYRHTACADWGHAILAWERGPRRAYQFEDGKLRTFRKGYYDRLREVDAPADEAARIIAALELALGRTTRTAAAADGGATVSLDDQLRVLRMQYPDGFGDAKWLRDVRGQGAPRRLKRHRDPAIAEARRRLSKDAFDDAASVHGAAVELLSATNLVTARQLELLKRLPDKRHAAFADALGELLYGDSPGELRFERYVAMLSLASAKGPSWELVTALPALVQPDRHLCVRAATVRKQAAWMAPRLTWTRTPNATVYGRVLALAARVAEELSDAGLQPADLMDIHDFMVSTLKPSALALLEN